MNKKSHVIIWEVAGGTEKDYLQDCVCVFCFTNLGEDQV